MERDISYALIRQETLDRLFAAIDRLPPQYREIFELNFEQGLKNKEIARLLDVAEITFKKERRVCWRCCVAGSAPRPIC